MQSKVRNSVVLPLSLQLYDLASLYSPINLFQLLDTVFVRRRALSSLEE